MKIIQIMLLAALVPSAVAAAQDDPINGLYIHGMPTDLAAEYAASLDEKSIAELADRLADSDSADYWPNITKVLASTGDPIVIDPLIDFIEGRQHIGEWSSALYRGRLSAILALGRFVGHSDSSPDIDRVMAYLHAAAFPDHWDNREVTWMNNRSYKPNEVREQLCITAVMGLSMTGEGAIGMLGDIADRTKNERVKSMAVSKLEQQR